MAIDGERLFFEIRGKASHTNSNVQMEEKTSSVRARFADGVFRISVYTPDEAADHADTYQTVPSSGKILLVNSIPLFYEQRDYEIFVEYMKENPDDQVEFWHENEFLRNRVIDRVRSEKEKARMYGGRILPKCP